jgi:hypothetical protein
MLIRAFDGAQATRWIQRSTPALYCDGGDRWLNEDWPANTNPSTEHAYDLLQRSHRLDVTAFRSATGWNPRFGPSALAFVPSSQPLARLEMR